MGHAEQFFAQTFDGEANDVAVGAGDFGDD